MSVRTLIGLVSLIGLVGLAQLESTAADVVSAEANQGGFHHRLIALDTHIDIPIELGIDSADPGLDGPMQVDLPKMRSGGLDAGFFIVYVAQSAPTEEGYKQAYEQSQHKFAAIERMLAMYPEQIQLARNPVQLRSILAEGKLVAAIGIENAYPLGPNLEHLQEFYDRGARYISLTHFGHNHFADSSVAKGDYKEGDYEPSKEPINLGISDLGLQLIEEMNRLGIMVDVSHTSAQTTIQAAVHSKTPVIASHSGVKALYDHPRNMTDEEIRAVAERGGVIQLVAFDSYMREVTELEKMRITEIRESLGLVGPQWYLGATQAQMGAARVKAAQLSTEFPRASIATLVDHIDYVVNLVGVDHAGISSDFGGGGGIQGWDHIGQTAAVTEELLARGYSQPDIEKIWGGNLLRVWEAVESYGKKLNN